MPGLKHFRVASGPPHVICFPAQLAEGLCHSLTGTLTLNKLSVDSATVLCLGGHSVEEILKLSALSSQINSEEAIDVVLVESYHGKEGLWNGLKQSKFVPFNPVDKYTISHITEDSTGNSYRLLKGAPQASWRSFPHEHAW